MQKPRTLSGFQELLPSEQAAFDMMVAKIRSVYSLFGFAPLDTPILEASEVLLAKGGGETEKQIYRFMKGDTDLAMRFDLTVPLAKYVALHYGELTFPFRRFQIGKVYRGERSQRGRFREFYQADIDVVGDGTLDISNEAEIPSIIYKVFKSLGLKNFRIHFNNRKVLNGLFEHFGLSDKSSDIMRTIDKIDKIGRDKVIEILNDDFEVSPKAISPLLDILGSSKPLTILQLYSGKNALLDEGISELKTVKNYLSSFGVPKKYYKIDLKIARGLDYYTGTVYETIMTEHPEIGSICSGGRYDNLAEYYTKNKLPGVGISIGLTRLFFILQEQEYINTQLNTAPADVLIIPMTDDLSYAIQVAEKFRKKGIRAQIHAEKKKIQQKFGYADKLEIPFAAVVGEDEIASNKVTVKQLSSGEQITESVDITVDYIKSVLKKIKKTKIIAENPFSK